MLLSLERSFKYCSKPALSLVNAAAAALFLAMCASTCTALAQTLPVEKPAAEQQSPTGGGAGRLYIFRPIRSFGAHIDDDVTVNGIPAHRVTPGTGFYCDVPPGDYVIAVLRHKTKPLKVSVEPGQKQFICVMLHQLDGVAPRGGALTSDQSFDVRLLAPDYAAYRVRDYPFVRANCQR
jgi:hypothetical protein